MLMTNQQLFLMETLEILGGAELRQLVALIRPVFFAEKPEVAARVVEAAIRQFRYCNVELRREGDLVYFPERKPGALLLEAVDVMLELSDSGILSFHRGRPPILLHFSVQEKKTRTFAVTTPEAELYETHLDPAERIILLFDGQSQKRKLPVSNKQFCAVRQPDGTHRFFAVDGQT